LLLGGVAGLLVLGSTRRAGSREADANKRRAENIAAYRVQLRELDEAQRASRMEPEHYQAERARIERALLVDAAAADGNAPVSATTRALPLVIAVMAPLLAFGIYQLIGSADRVQLDARMKELERVGSAAEMREKTASIVPLLERIARGHDPEGGYRFLLARIYMAQDRTADAALQFEQLTALFPQDAALLAQAARARYIAAGNRMTPQVESLVSRGLALDPVQPVLLGMLGMDRFQAGDFAAALAHWDRLLAQLPPNAPDRAIIADGIALARERLGVRPPQEAPMESARLRIVVSLAPEMQVRPEDAVFVYARAVAGPRMPLAVARLRVADLPREVELNDAMAMAPGLSLSSFAEVEVMARVSATGIAMPAPGDLQAAPQRVVTAEQKDAVTLVIDRVIGSDGTAAPR
jgi:cytochrome c-type biogenesis protein CcmH